MTKENKIRFLLILASVILLCHGFLQMHFSSDTVVLWDLGYMNYPQEYFLLDGRLISALVCFLGGLLGLPLEVYIIGMTAIAIVFVSMAIYVMSDVLIRLIKPKNNLNIAVITIISSLLVLNQYSLEFLLFPESAVMCLGLFLIFYAIKIWLFSQKMMYLKVTGIILVATICYQGLLNIFPLLVLFIYGLKALLGESINLKKAILDLLKLAVITALALVITLGIVEFGLQFFESNQDRSNRIENYEDLVLVLAFLFANLNEVWNENISMLPHYINYIIIGVTTLFLILLNTKAKIIGWYFFIIICTLGMCIVPMFLFNTGPVGRVNVPIAMIWGISLAYLYVASANHSSKTYKSYVQNIVFVSFMINSIFILENISEHNKADAIDENQGLTMKYHLEQYEAETGIIVTKFGYIYDNHPEQYAPGIRPLGSFTERKFAVPWSIYQVANYYCERNFERIYIPEMLDENFDVFSEDQIYFKDDEMYLVVY